MSSLLDQLSDIAGAAFHAEGLEASFGVVQRSDRPDLAQFQCNGALAAAKQAKTNPRAIGEAIAARLKDHDAFADVSIAGPGFLNLTLRDEFLAANIAALIADDKLGAWQKPAPQKLVIDYGGPNVAKPLHVGHLRAAIIGEAMKRIARFVGDDVTGDVHLGDWGKQMGQLLCQIKLEQPDLPYFDPDFTGPYPETSPVTLEDLARAYPLASAACKEDEARNDEARVATADLQSGRAGYRALWAHFVAVSRAGLEREYADLGVFFDLWNGESDADPFIQPVTKVLEEKKLLVESDGARVVHVARDSDKKDIPPLIMYSRDGSVLYGSTDIATILDRVENLKPDTILYVVDQRQAQHFEQVFRVASLAGLIPEEALEHIGFGTMNGKDGKPFKTRDGGTLQLRDLIDMVSDKALERLKENGAAEKFGADEVASIAHQVGMAALKFADLSNPRMTDYIFDLDRFIAFEGKTGPYLLYAAIRISSVLEKTDFDDTQADAPIVFSHQTETDLALTLAGFAEALKGAYDKRMPHILCEHAYGLAQAFSKFYGACRMADEPDAALRQSRLTLARATGRQLRLILEVLGMDVPARM